MEHGTIFFDLKIQLEQEVDESARFEARLPDSMLPSFSSAYNTAFVTVSYGLCLHSESGEVLSVEPVMMTQNAPEESGRMNKKTRLATFVTRNLNWCAFATTTIASRLRCEGLHPRLILTTISVGISKAAISSPPQGLCRPSLSSVAKGH